MKVPFVVPKVTQNDIDEVVKVLKSGWITSGPILSQFQSKLAEYLKVDVVRCTNSATMGLEVVLKTLGIGKDDEVITTAFTYTASASPAFHLGCRVLFAEVKKDTFHLDIESTIKLVTSKTKVIIPMDYAGIPFKYQELQNRLKEIKREDIYIIADSAHSFGSIYQGKKLGSQADIHIFSFQAVKNLTTGEGGAISFNQGNKLPINFLRNLELNILQGQDKDCLNKNNGSWEYDIVTDGMKCNMTDINAALGLNQLNRYEDILSKRRVACDLYDGFFKPVEKIMTVKHKGSNYESSYHLYPIRIVSFSEKDRNALINRLFEKGITCNVHYKPLPLMTFYSNAGYNIEDYPLSFSQYENSLTLPLFNDITAEEIQYVVKQITEIIS